VLGCAALVAAHPGAVVVTVTAGRPGPHALTDWDRRCGFAQGDDVVGARRGEDQAALALLGARPVWLDFLDRQYGASPSHADLVAAIGRAVEDAAMVASPLGLFHEDHLLTAGACFDVARARRDVRWVVYEDAIYRPVAGRTDQALAALRADGFVLRDVTYPEAPAKGEAIRRYPSQLRGLADLLADAYRPERYWSLNVK
jgi:LmbE family N-acetylglucosaminyl deacetylase